MVTDLLVVGLDMVTGLEVHAEDRETREWRKKGHNGDQTLVCLACYQGADLPDGPQVVALVPKGKEGGARCRHFAHPPGMTPPQGRHNPESLEHAYGKQALRGWAADQGFPARVEAWTADGRRRSDVEVILPGGARVAIELQCSEITDAEWLDRHEDYVPGRDHRRVALASRHLDTQGRVPVRPARLAARLGGGEDRADLRSPRSCCRHSGIGAAGMRHGALPAMLGRPHRPLVDAAGIGAARARRDRAIR